MSATVITEGGFTVDARKGLLVLAWRIGGKRYVVKTRLAGKTRRDAERVLQAARRERIAEVEAAAGYDPTTMAALATDWLAEVTKLSAAKGARYAGAVDLLIEAHGAVSSIDYAATPGLAKSLLAARAAAGIRPATNARLRFVIGAVCQYGVEHRRMPTNPARTMGKTPRAEGVEAKDHRWLDLGQHALAAAYIADADNHDAQTALVAALMFAGLRSQEARALTWLDVDYRRNVLVVDDAVKAGGTIGATKTKASRREVPIHPTLRAVLVRQAAAQLAEGTYRAEGLVFPGANGGPLTADNVTKAAKAFARNTGLTVEGRHLHPHGYRHTFAVVCLEGGLTMHQVAKLLGHVDASMVAKVYGHAGRDNAGIDLGAVMAAAAAKTAEAEAVEG